MSRAFVLLFSLNLFLVGCSKDNPVITSVISSIDTLDTIDTIPQDTITHMIPQELKDYCVFKSGTRWIYEDSLTGQRDTFIGHSYLFSSFVDGANWEISVTGFGMVNYSPQTPVSQVISGDQYLISPKADSGRSYIRYRETVSTGPGSTRFSTLLFYPFVPGHHVDSCTIIGVYDSIYGFANVVETTCDKSLTHYAWNQTTRSHYAKNIGLIRLQVENKVMKLVEFNIVQ